MPVTQNTSSLTLVASGPTLTVAYTAGSGSSRGLLVYVQNIDPLLALSSVTWQGANLTLLVSGASDSSGGALWGMANPASGSGNVVATYSSTAVGANVIIADFIGVDQATPFGTGIGDGYISSAATAHSHATGSVTDALIADFFAIDSGAGSPSADVGQSVQQGPTVGDGYYATYSSKAGGASVTTGYTWTNPFYRWVHATVGVNPEAVGVSRSVIVRQAVHRAASY